MLRKTLLITWLLVTAMSLVSVGAVSAETTLKDFNGHWAASTISKWIDQGLIKGYEDNTYDQTTWLTGLNCQHG